MVSEQQAAYVPISNWHQHRWRVGRRLALKHNLTFPSHLVLHCYSSHRKISRGKWIALGNLLKNQLLTLQCRFSFLLNQSATLLTTFSCTKGNAVGFNDRAFIFIADRFSRRTLINRDCWVLGVLIFLALLIILLYRWNLYNISILWVNCFCFKKIISHVYENWWLEAEFEGEWL